MRFVIAVLIVSGCFSQAEEAAPAQQVRRLYIDLFERFPDVREVKKGVEEIKNYGKFVDSMLSSDEFRKTLAKKVTAHYSPDLSAKRNSAGEVDPKYFKRFIRMQRLVEHKYLRQNDFRDFIKDLVGGRGVSSGRGALYFYDADESVEELTGRFADRVLGMPLKCAQCHDHRKYDKIFQMDFWSLAAFFKDIKVIELNTRGDLQGIRNIIAKEFQTRILTNLMPKEDYVYFKDWVKDEGKGTFIFSGEDMEFVEEGRSRRKTKETKLLADQLMVLEKSVYLLNLKIQYTDDKKDVVNAAVPGTTASPNIKVVPREYLADWVVSKKNPLLKRAVANWVSNWILGRGFNMPLTDVYGNGKNEALLKQYGNFLEAKNFDIRQLVKKMVMSELYRRAPAVTPDMEKVELFAERTFRQVPAETLLRLVRLSSNSQKEAFATELEKQAGILSNFPRNEENCESSFTGTVNQSVYMSFDAAFTRYIEEKSEKAGEDGEKLVREAVIKFLSRVPTEQETKILSDLLKGKEGKERQQAYADVLWILINSPEMRIY